jgi:hypothetical protein
MSVSIVVREADIGYGSDIGGIGSRLAVPAGTAAIPFLGGGGRLERFRLFVRLLLVAVAGLLLAYFINIVTGGTLPAALEPYRAYAWWIAGVLAVIVVAGAVAEGLPPRRSRRATPGGTATAGDRRDALVNVQARIRERLDQSLARTLRAHLGVELVPASVTPPRNWYVERGGRELEPGVSILDTFRLLDESLLVLGAPGAGKTTTLLELAEALAGEAAQDAGAPLPVLIDLGNWTRRRGGQPRIEDWIFDQIHGYYGIGEGLARTWLSTRGLVLLLDGLDEIAASDDRRECVHLLNELQVAFPKVRIAVASRLVEYQELPEQLSLRGAIVIQPLTAGEVERWLRSPGLECLRAAVDADNSLRELLTAPLWLQLMTVIFSDTSQAPHLSGGITERRAQLLDAFFVRMLAGRATAAEASRIKKHLIVTARAISQSSRTAADPRPFRGRWAYAIPVQHESYLWRRVLPVCTVACVVVSSVVPIRHWGWAGAAMSAVLAWMLMTADLYFWPSTVAVAAEWTIRLRCWILGILLVASAVAAAILAGPAAQSLAESNAWIGGSVAWLLLASPWISMAIPQDRDYLVLLPLFGGPATGIAVWVWLATPLTFATYLAMTAAVPFGLLWAAAVHMIQRGKRHLFARATEDYKFKLKCSALVTAGLFLCVAWVTGIIDGHLTWGTGLFAYSTFCLYAIVEIYLSPAPSPGKQPIPHWLDRWTLVLLGVFPLQIRPVLVQAAKLGIMQHDGGAYRFFHPMLTAHLAETDSYGERSDR